MAVHGCSVMPVNMDDEMDRQLDLPVLHQKFPNRIPEEFRKELDDAAEKKSFRILVEFRDQLDLLEYADMVRQKAAAHPGCSCHQTGPQPKTHLPGQAKHEDTGQKEMKISQVKNTQGRIKQHSGQHRKRIELAGLTFGQHWKPEATSGLPDPVERPGVRGQ